MFYLADACSLLLVSVSHQMDGGLVNFKKEGELLFLLFALCLIILANFNGSCAKMISGE